jgi:hypothetical protein
MINDRDTVAMGSRAQITSHILFEHTNGAHLWVSSSPNGMLIGITEQWNEDTEDCAAMDIGIEGLKLLAFRLLALATELEAAR